MPYGENHDHAGICKASTSSGDYFTSKEIVTSTPSQNTCNTHGDILMTSKHFEDSTACIKCKVQKRAYRLSCEAEKLFSGCYELHHGSTKTHFFTLYNETSTIADYGSSSVNSYESFIYCYV